MKIFDIFFSFSFFVVGIPAFAQQGINTSGSNAAGTGGSVSYTIGQFDYSTSNSGGYTITEGVQQPYEIFTITGIDVKQVNLTFSIYPNPTVDFLTLKVDNYKTEDFTVLLCDAQGKTLFSRTVETSETSISMKDLSNAFYYVKVLRNSREVKIFKVIKSN